MKSSNVLFRMPNIKESGLRLNAANSTSPGCHRYPFIPLFKVYHNWKGVVRCHVGVPSKSCGIRTLMKQFLVSLQIYIPIDHVSELHSAVVALLMLIKRRSQTMQTVQSTQTVLTMQLLCLLFLKL